MAVSTRPISARPISSDIEDAAAQQGRFKRQYRAPVAADRYPGIGDESPAMAAEPEPSKTPIYDSLAPEVRAKVDRFIIGYRMAKRGVA